MNHMRDSCWRAAPSNYYQHSRGGQIPFSDLIHMVCAILIDPSDLGVETVDKTVGRDRHNGLLSIWGVFSAVPVFDHTTSTIVCLKRDPGWLLKLLSRDSSDN